MVNGLGGDGRDFHLGNLALRLLLLIAKQYHCSVNKVTVLLYEHKEYIKEAKQRDKNTKPCKYQ